MRLRPGIRADSAGQRLTELVHHGRNEPSSHPNLAYRHRAFSSWMHDVETTLVSMFDGVRIETLHTERYWRVISLGSTGVAMPHQLISDEVEHQIRTLAS